MTLSVKGAGIGTLTVAAEDADNRPLAIAKVDICCQHCAVALALHLVIHRIGQPCHLLCRADLVGFVLCTLAMGLTGGDAIPAVLGTGGIQQFLQLAAGGGICLFDGSQAFLPRLLDGGIVAQIVQLHCCRRFNGGFTALQRIGQQILAFFIEAADVAQLGCQLRNVLLRQCIQLLLRRIAGFLQSRRCRRVHIRCRLALREGGCQVGQCLSGVGLDDLDFLCGGSLIQLQLPALIGGQQRGHVFLRILLIDDEFIIEILLCLLRIGDDLKKLAILTQILQPDIINVRNGFGGLDLFLCRRQQLVDLRLFLSRVHAAVHIGVEIGQQLLTTGIRTAQHRGKLLLTFLHQRVRVAVGQFDALYVRQHNAVIADALLRTIDIVILVAGTDQLYQQPRRGGDLIPTIAIHGKSGHHAGHTGRVEAAGIRHVYYAPQHIGRRALHMPDLAAVPFTYDTAYALRRGTAVIRHGAGIIGVGEGARAGEASIVSRTDIAHDTAGTTAQGRAATAGISLVQHVHDDNVQHAAGDIFIQAGPADDTAHAALALYSTAVLAQAYLRVVCQQAYNAAHALNAIDCTLIGAVADYGVLASHAYNATDVVNILAASHCAVVVAAVYDGVYRCFSGDATCHSTVVRTVIADIHRRGTLENGTHTIACDTPRPHTGGLITRYACHGDRTGHL